MLSSLALLLKTEPLSHLLRDWWLGPAMGEPKSSVSTARNARAQHQGHGPHSLQAWALFSTCKKSLQLLTQISSSVHQMD